MKKMATKDFSIDELSCKCGCGAYDMRPEFLNLLQALRDRINRPMIITSGYRCKKYNDSLSHSSKNSQHLVGRAVDIHCVTSIERANLVALALELGFRGVGIDSAFVHLDYRESDIKYMWLYPTAGDAA